MREILFKGRLKNNGEWICGYYIKSRYYEGGAAHFIVDTENEYDDYGGFSLQYEIDPNTLCQYTGLTDKNGKKIFENDIVKYGETVHKVAFGNAYFGIVMNGGKHHNEIWSFSPLVPADKMNVIGNIFDNPEICKTPTVTESEDNE